MPSKSVNGRDGDRQAPRRAQTEISPAELAGAQQAGWTPAQPGRSRVPPPLTPANAYRLQQTVGNSTVARRLRKRGAAVPGLQRVVRVLGSVVGGVVKNFQITGRFDNFWVVATNPHPSAAGQDRRHIIAWVAMKYEIHQNIANKTPDEARQYITNPAAFRWQGGRVSEGGEGMNEAAYNAWVNGQLEEVAQLWDDGHIPEAIKLYAQSRYNDPENLFMGASQPNQELGRKIVSARKRVMAVWNYLKKGDTVPEFSLELPPHMRDPQRFRFAGEDDRERVPMINLGDVVSWYANMMVDWGDDYDNWMGAMTNLISDLSIIDGDLAQRVQAGIDNAVAEADAEPDPD